jgi:predicted dehydrogenase
VDYSCFLFGEVKSVYAVGYKNHKGARNNQTAVLKFKNGTRAVVTACQEMSANYPFTMGARLLGENGTIEFQYSAGQLLRGKADTRLVKYLNDKDEPENIQVPPGDGYYNEIRYFIDCVLAGREPAVAPPEESIKVLRVIEAIKESLEKEKEVCL